MPLLRHECTKCGLEVTPLLGLHDPPPEHCGQAMRLLMPRRVVGRVAPDSNGVHTGSGFAAPTASKPRGVWSDPIAFDDHGRDVELHGDHEGAPSWRPPARAGIPLDHDDPLAVQQPTGSPFAKDYEDCTAAQRDARWHDTAEAQTAATVRALEAKGSDPSVARATASEATQRMIERTRSEVNRDDGKA